MMTLSALMPELESDSSIEIFGISDDSRKVQKGDLFIAVSGEHYSVSRMMDDVANSEISAVLCDESELMPVVEYPLFKVSNLSARKGALASRFYGDPSSHLVVTAVTGTNGKTSCSQFIAAALDVKCGVVGTLGSGFLPDLKGAGLTTPDAISLQKTLAELLDEGAEAVCLEASSHGLVQGRLNGITIDTAVFTNITRDHLDYHRSFEAYKAAKQILFRWPGLKTAVLNLDDEFASQVMAVLDSDVCCLTYSVQNPDANIYCSSFDYELTGISAQVETPWGVVELRSPLIGDFNLSNLLAVVGVVGAQGMPVADVSTRLAEIKTVVGRMDQIPLEKGAVVIIDYAHTPNALENALRAVRVHCTGNLWCVMGCGGDRDVGKRPMMGAIASRLADITIVTDDNPRTESSAEIIEHILAGVIDGAEVRVESDRRSAIALALESAKAGDLVLIAGKGHETYQEIQGERQNFSDYAEVERFQNSYHGHRGA